MSKIVFPEWVENAKTKKEERKRNRLKYLLQVAAKRLDPKSESYYDVIGKACQINRTTVYKAVRGVGHVSLMVAQRIEAAVGRRYMKYEWLMDPLSVNADTTTQLLASPKNAARLLKSVSEIKAGKAKVRELINPVATKKPAPRKSNKAAVETL